MCCMKMAIVKNKIFSFLNGIKIAYVLWKQSRDCISKVVRDQKKHTKKKQKKNDSFDSTEKKIRWIVCLLLLIIFNRIQLYNLWLETVNHFDA